MRFGALNKWTKPWLASVLVTLTLSQPALAYNPPIGKPMPPIQGTSLTGQPLAFPTDFTGRPVILILGFYRESQTPLEAWARSLIKPGTPSSRLSVYVMPMMGNGPLKMMTTWIVDQLRRQIPRPHHDKVVPVFGDLDPIKSAVGYTTTEKAYTLLIDGQGTIRGAWVGMPTASSYKALQTAIQSLADRLGDRPQRRKP